MHLLLSQAKDLTEAVQPSLTLLDKTVLGSLLVISWALTIALVVQLIRVQNARVADQKTLSDKSERLMAKMLTAFSEMKGALESLKEAEQSGQQATNALKNAIDSMQRAFDIFLITQGRRFTPQSGVSRAAIDEALRQQEAKKREGEGNP